MSEGLYDDYISLFWEKNSDGTKNLRLKGNEFIQRVGRRLDEYDMRRVTEFLAEHDEIVSLDLSYNEIGDEGMAVLTEDFLCYQNNLKHLNVMTCDLGCEGMKKLHSVCDTLKLETLRVNGNKLGFQGNRMVAMLIRDLHTLTHVDVGDTDLTPDAVEMITDVVAASRSVKVLDISRVIPEHNKQRLNPGDLMENVSFMMERNSNLVELHIQKCELDGHDVELLLDGLTRNDSLKLLDLGYNRICCHGLEHLASWIRTGPNLQALNVAGCGIRDMGMTALSFAVPFSKLRLLDISFNNITDVGMIDFLHSLKKPFQLRYFFFWGNTFGHKTNVILERMLQAGSLEQDNLDTKLYTVDEVIYAAFYPMNHYKHKYYCVMDTGVPVELKIKRNKLEDELTQPKALVNYNYYTRYPAVLNPEDIVVYEKKHPEEDFEEEIEGEYGEEEGGEEATATEEKLVMFESLSDKELRY